MSHALTVAVSDQVWTALQRQATSTGTPPDKLAASVLAEHFAPPSDAPPSKAAAVRKRKEDMTEEEKKEAMRRLERHFGAVSVADSTGLDNRTIDEDLAREYGATHDPRNVD